MDTNVTTLDPVAEAEKGMRLLRDEAIANTDWMMLPDAVLPSEVTIDQIKAYRKYLRDLPNNSTKDDFMTFKGIESMADWIAANK